MKKNICMVVFSYYPEDTRVRREAESLNEQGFNVDVICLKKKEEKKAEKLRNINIYRINMSKKRNGKLRYIYEYLIFTIFATIKIALLHFRKIYSIIHVHNMPDFLVLTAIIPKFSKAKVILDLHDPTPEVYMTKYGKRKNHPIIKLMFLIEKYSIRFSNLVLTPNKAFERLFINRGCPENKIQIVMNSPQEEIFLKSRKDKISQENKKYFNIMYHGTIVERHGLDTALDALNEIKEKIPYVKLHVFGDGDSFKSTFLKKIKDLKLNDYVQYYGYQKVEIISKRISETDLGIIPNKKSIFTELNFPVRIFEYLCLNKPVIVPDTTGIRDYFDDSSILFFKPGDVKSLADAIEVSYFNHERINSIIRNGKKVYNRYKWSKQKVHLVNTVERLLY